MPNDRTPSHPKGPYFFQKRTEGPVDITITESQISDLDHYDDADFDTRLATKDTDDLTEGTNLYFTNARADARIALATLADLAAADAADLSGTLADARLSANVPLLDAENTFTDAINNFSPPTGPITISLDSVDSSAAIDLDAPAGNVRDVRFRSSGSARWVFRVDQVAETGSNAGSNFNINRRSDAGADLGNPLSISRATGIVSLAAGLSIGGGQTIADSDNVPLLDAANTFLDFITFSGSPVAALFSGTVSITKTDGTEAAQNCISDGDSSIRLGTDSSGNRWRIRKNTNPETGSDAGSQLDITSYNDAGGGESRRVRIYRDTGLVQFDAGIILGGKTVSIGAVDTAGAGFRALRVPN